MRLLARIEDCKRWTGERGHEELPGAGIDGECVRIFWAGQGFQDAMLRAVDDRDVVAVRVGDVDEISAGVHRDGLRACEKSYTNSIAREFRGRWSCRNNGITLTENGN